VLNHKLITVLRLSTSNPVASRRVGTRSLHGQKKAFPVKEDLAYEKDTQEDKSYREGNGKPPWQIHDT